MSRVIRKRADRDSELASRTWPPIYLAKPEPRMKVPIKWLLVCWLVLLLGLAFLAWYGGTEPAPQPPQMLEY